MKPENLSQVAVIVTGAAGGLGAAMTRALIEGGARVLAVDIDGDALAGLAERLPEGRIAAHAGDIRDADSCAGIVARAVSEFGAVHALVNNAGIGQSSIRASYYIDRVKFWEVTDERWRTVVETNAMAPFMLAKAILPHLTEAGWGRIVNVTTSLDTMTRPGWTPYGPSKAALEASTAIWAGDLEGTGITVNVLIPGGPANTAMVPPASSPDRDAMIQPAVMAAPIRWLLDRASDGGDGAALPRRPVGSVAGAGRRGRGGLGARRVAGTRTGGSMARTRSG